MKKLLITALLASSFASRAQVVLEHAYNGSYPVQLISIENEGHKYLTFDPVTMKAMIYNPNHSLFRSFATNIPANAFIWSSFDEQELAYASKFLFNTDSLIEIVVHYTPHSGSAHTTEIYNETGTALYTFADVNNYEVKKVGSDWKFITETISPTTAGNAHNTFTSVYSLPGQYTGVTKLKNNDGTTESSIYPNPMDQVATIEYNLPNGVNQAQISVYNSMGIMVRTYQVTSNYKDIIIQRNELPAGQYTYSVSAPGYNSVSQKFIVK